MVHDDDESDDDGVVGFGLGLIGGVDDILWGVIFCEFDAVAVAGIRC